MCFQDLCFSSTIRFLYLLKRPLLAQKSVNLPKYFFSVLFHSSNRETVSSWQAVLPRHIMASCLSYHFLKDYLQTLSSSDIHSSNQCLLSVLWSGGGRQGPNHVVVLKQVRHLVPPGLCDFDLRLALAIWKLVQIKRVYQKLWKFRCQWVGNSSYQEYFYIDLGWLIILAQLWQ